MFRKPLSFEGHRMVKGDIDKPAATQSATGAPSSGWTAFAAGIPAAIENVSGLERYADQMIQGVSRFDVLIRYLRGVTERMRFTFTNDGTTFRLDIENVDNVDMANRWMILHCKSGVNRG